MTQVKRIDKEKVICEPLGVMRNDQDVIREAMRLLGRRKSERKMRACRENARKSWSESARVKRGLTSAKSVEKR